MLWKVQSQGLLACLAADLDKGVPPSFMAYTNTAHQAPLPAYAYMSSVHFFSPRRQADCTSSIPQATSPCSSCWELHAASCRCDSRQDPSFAARARWLLSAVPLNESAACSFASRDAGSQLAQWRCCCVSRTCVGTIVLPIKQQKRKRMMQ